jgi:arsenite methyltransferase
MEGEMTTNHDDAAVKEIVRQRYAEAAKRVTQGAGASCCGGGAVSSCCGAAPATIGGSDPITADLYDAVQAGAVPDTALLASLGCGNPTALAELKTGETVLDLGSGGGIDVLLSARRVGPSGIAYGLDMTDEMLALAQENKRKSGVANVHFLKGEIEHIPLPADSVDVIISNCVINLAADKDRVLAEAFRVLKPGGRFAVSDVIVRGEMPPAIRRNMELWIGCVAGALADREYLDKLARAGFVDASIEVTRVYGADDAREFLAAQGAELQQLALQVDGKFASGFIRASKPAAALAGAAAQAASAAADTRGAAAPEVSAASCCGSTACRDR